MRLSGRGVAPADGDGDGDVDLLVANYTLHRNLYYDNDGDGTVTSRAAEAGLEGNGIFAGATYYGHTIGAAWGDLDGDGQLDMVHANLAHPRFYHFSDRTQVLLNDGGGVWRDASDAAGLRYQETHSVPMLADFDHDGALDLVITAVYPGRPTDFYWGRGDGTFALDAYGAGIPTEDGWGATGSDFDHDGDVDLATDEVFRNVSQPAGHWLNLRIIGNVDANRAAIGATVTVTAGDNEVVRHVQGGTGQGCQDSLFLHFGLGDATNVDAIRVVFPGGKAVDYGPVATNERHWLYEDGTVVTGWAPP